MDPNLFHLDWERVFEALVAIIVLAFLVERALSPIFECRPFIVSLDRPGVKELIAVAVAVTGCLWWQFDAISIILLAEKTTIPGAVVTGCVIAGGSKASIKLFHDVLNIKSATFERRHEVVAEAAASQAAEAVEKARAQGPAAVPVVAENKVRRLVKRAEEAASQSGSRESTEAVAKARGSLVELERINAENAK